MKLPDDAVQVAIAHCESAYPREGCGVFLRDGEGRITARQMANVAESRTQYRFDPREQLEVFGSGEVVAIFHSHADAGAYFSAEDRAQAVVGGQPMFPGVEYLVMSVRKTADESALFAWDGADFVEIVASSSR